MTPATETPQLAMDFRFDPMQTLARVDEVLHDVNVRWPAEAPEQQLLRILRNHFGSGDAISRATLSLMMGRPDRVIRRLVKTLREDFQVRIGSNRTTGGYYLVATAEEARELSAKIFTQAFSLLRLGHALGGKHATAEFFGQARIHLGLDKETL